MTRTMYDGIASDAPGIPTSAQLVAGYDDGLYVWSAADWARFPNSVHVHIAVFASTNSGVVLDVETGDATPAQSVDWVLMRRAAGADPTVYCNTSTWPQVRSAFQARGVAEPHYWLAQYDNVATLIPGAVAKQYADDIMLGRPYDLSVVADYWPGVDPSPQGAPQMEQTDKVIGNRSRGNTVGDVLADLSNLRDELYLALGIDSNNPPPANSRLAVLISQIDDIHTKVNAIAAPDPAAFVAAFVASPDAITKFAAALAAVLPTADQIATAEAKHISADLANG